MNKSLWQGTISMMFMAATALGALSGPSLPAFPGAEGFGTTTVGGRGGKVLFVTNLNDAGPGSLRAACEAEGPRIVVFRTGGTIVLKKQIVLRKPFITIAGQTAPGGGICLRNDPDNTGGGLSIQTHDVVVRYLRIRPGASRKQTSGGDALCVDDGGRNVVIDHCSLSWATDEVCSTWGNPRDVTFQWCFITEGLHAANHPKGPHCKGMLLGSEGCENITVHHCLFAHNDERNPRVKISGVLDFVNNAIYDPDAQGVITDEFALAKMNYVGNYVQLGPCAKSPERFERLSRYELFAWDRELYGFELFVRGNIGPHRMDEAMPENCVVDPRSRRFLMVRPHPAPPITTQDARSAYRLVLEKAGATLPVRDAVDERVVRDALAGTGRIIDDPAEVGGWPVLKSGVALEDGDQDGMPDAWERQHRLDPVDGTDGNRDADGDGYTNIEEWLNGTDPNKPSATSRPT